MGATPFTEAWQQQTALQKANRIRLGRAKLLHRLADLGSRESCCYAADIVADPPEVLATMEAFDFVVKIRQMGNETARNLLEAVDVPEQRKLEDLTPRERAALVGALRYRGSFHYPHATRKAA